MKNSKKKKSMTKLFYSRDNNVTQHTTINRKCIDRYDAILNQSGGMFNGDEAQHTWYNDHDKSNSFQSYFDLCYR